MPKNEASNIIIKLKQEGWDDAKINAFILYIQTHTPTEEEARTIIEQAHL
ncbi:MAG: hypothetical protein K6B14_09210 [Lachnospiraceae bacterium]|nr:hypothetical protein [Lachnospiraceae bacterium]